MISTRICKEFCRHNFEGQKNTLLRLSELTSSTIQMVMNSIPESKLDKLWTTSEIHLKCRFLAHTKRSSCKSLSHCIYPHCDPKPTCLEVFIVNSLVFKWPQPLFFMVLGAHGIYIYIYIWHQPKQRTKTMGKFLQITSNICLFDPPQTWWCFMIPAYHWRATRISLVSFSPEPRKKTSF